MILRYIFKSTSINFPVVDFYVYKNLSCGKNFAKVISTGKPNSDFNYCYNFLYFTALVFIVNYFEQASKLNYLNFSS